jgi:competence protein ComEC
LVISERILAALPGESGAIAAALMTGARGAIPEATLTAMRDSGLAHLLAISGLHVGLVAGLLFFGIRASLALVPALALRYPIKKWAAASAALGAFAYLALTGASVPTQRAFLMVGLVLLGILLDRSALSFRLIAWAAVVVLAVAPESLLSPSFQMSFAAVAALIAAYEVLRDRWRRLFGGRGAIGGPLSWAGRQVSGAALSSIIAGLATAPFAVYHFNRIAWYGLAANVVAVPLTALWIMPWALVAFALMPFGAEGLALAPMGWGIEVVLAVARQVAAWPGAVSLVAVMPIGALVSIALGGLWLCLWRRPWRLLGVLPIAAGALATSLAVPPDVLVSGDAKLMAVRDGAGGLYLSSAKLRRFDAGIWRRRLGLEDSEPWPRLGQAAEGRLSCDPLGCIYRVRGQVVALSGDGRALADDCAVASVVISREPVRGRCQGPGLVIDRFDLWRQGGHAIWLGDKEIRVETVRDRRGARPWVRQRGGR